MLSLSSLIEFLLDMLRDEATQAEFERDPSGTLAARGLSDVTAQDVRDVQPMLADVGGVHRVVHSPDHDGHAASLKSHAFAGSHGGGYGGSGHGGSGHGGGPDVVREIHHVTREYTVARPVTEVTQEYKTYNSFTEFSTDNSVHAAEGSTVIQDSYNQDNDGVDNKGGVIEDSTVAGQDMAQSGNDVATTTVEGSGNDSRTEIASDDVGAPQEAAEPEDEGGDDGPPTITYGEFYGSGADPGDLNGSYSAQTPAASAAESDGAEHTAAGHV